MSAYPFSFVTVHGKIFDGKVDSVIAPGVEGYFGVLSQHAPMVAMLTRGVVSLRQEGVEKHFAVNQGILEVDGSGQVVLLAQEGVAADSINQAKEKAAAF
ncbi:MAG: ATP synthase F1 subunit epsilon [Candidatus Omnitrophota bacterium]